MFVLACMYRLQGLEKSADYACGMDLFVSNLAFLNCIPPKYILNLGNWLNTADSDLSPVFKNLALQKTYSYSHTQNTHVCVREKEKETHCRRLFNYVYVDHDSLTNIAQ